MWVDPRDAVDVFEERGVVGAELRELLYEWTETRVGGDASVDEGSAGGCEERREFGASDGERRRFDGVRRRSLSRETTAWIW